MELDAFGIFWVQSFPLTTWKVEEVEYQTVPSYKLRAKCRHGCSLIPVLVTDGQWHVPGAKSGKHSS